MITWHGTAFIGLEFSNMGIYTYRYLTYYIVVDGYDGVDGYNRVDV